MQAMEEEASANWLQQHLKASYEPLLEEPWVLDVDTTVKLLYGHQQDAVVGYNPTKPGRPSHAYQCAFNSCADSYFIGNARIVLDNALSTLAPVEVQAGNQTDPSFAQPELWVYLDALDERARPLFIRGDCQWGSEKADRKSVV